MKSLWKRVLRLDRAYADALAEFEGQRMITIPIERKDPIDGCRRCQLCGNWLRRGLLAGQIRELTKFCRSSPHLREQVLDRATWAFRRGEDWCFLCTYGAGLAWGSLARRHDWPNDNFRQSAHN